MRPAPLWRRYDRLTGSDPAADVKDELRFHLETKIDDLVAQGWSPEDARKEAERQFGDIRAVQQAGERIGEHMERRRRLADYWSDALRDLRYTLRTLSRDAGFVVISILILALGIGANTAIFTLVHGIFLVRLPVANPSQLYRVGDDYDCCVQDGFPGNASNTGDFTIFSADLYRHLRDNLPDFEQMAAMQAGQGLWSVRIGENTAKPFRTELVSGNYFSTFGLDAFAGRVFNEKDDAPSAPPVVVLSYQAWKSEFGAEPSVVGSTIFIQEKPFTVIGVAPRGFFGDRLRESPPDLWMPLEAQAYLNGDESQAFVHHPDTHWLYLIGRVRKGTNINTLESKVTTSLRQWLYSRPSLTANGGARVIPRMHVVLTPGGSGIQNLQEVEGKGVTLLMILSSVVLLVACANVANLMLVRSMARRAEIAVRMALGANTGRVIRQTLTESILLSCTGGIAGVAVAYAGARAILRLAFPETHSLPIAASPSPLVLGFAFVVSLVTGVLFGAAPAWLSSRAQPSDALRGANRSTRDRTTLPQRSLVILQTALSIVLLAAATLMTRTLINLQDQNLGVATANRYVVHFDFTSAGDDVSQLPGLYRRIEDRFSALPGFKAIGFATYSPLDRDGYGACVIPRGHPAPRPGDHCLSIFDKVSNQFLDSVGVPILRGRGFTAEDTATSTQVAIVNEAFVKQFFPGQDPIGQHFGINHVEYSSSFQIVGVFRDFKINNPRGAEVPIFLRPLVQRFTGYKEPEMIRGEKDTLFADSIVFSFSAPPPDADALIRHALAEVDPNLTITDLRTFDSQIAGNFTQERMIARLTSLFGILALILASIGIYGAMSYLVARRTGEIGIRMALGATRSGVVSMVIRGAIWQILAGLVLGVPAALYAGHLMRSLLYGVGSYDPVALAGAPLILVVFAAGAAFVPARRAASVEPMQALRTE